MKFLRKKLKFLFHPLKLISRFAPSLRKKYRESKKNVWIFKDIIKNFFDKAPVFHFLSAFSEPRAGCVSLYRIYGSDGVK